SKWQGRVELLAQGEIGEVEQSVLGPRAMVLGVLAEVLEPPEVAAAQRLTQQHEQPVDVALLRGHDRLHAVRQPAGLAVRERRMHPRRRRSVVHEVLPRHDEACNLLELGLQVVPDHPAHLAVLALRLAVDLRDADGAQVAERVNGSAARGGPREGRRYDAGLAASLRCRRWSCTSKRLNRSRRGGSDGEGTGQGGRLAKCKGKFTDGILYIRMALWLLHPSGFH
ncbi:unnamed protein product, partial [Musa acuminata subsp. malaccensis]